MKKLILLSLFALTVFAKKPIPHYDRYKPTPIVDYKEEILDFYSTKNLYGEFSNFAMFPIEIDGVMWPTSEHYYQAHKYTDPELIEWVRTAPSAYEAAKRGRDRAYPKRKDWFIVREQYMWTALIAKFSQYEVLQKLLLSTNKAKIYEHTKNDCYWGDCGDRTGVNRLGNSLEAIRSLLVEE